MFTKLCSVLVIVLVLMLVLVLVLVLVLPITKRRCKILNKQVGRQSPFMMADSLRLIKVHFPLSFLRPLFSSSLHPSLSFLPTHPLLHPFPPPPKATLSPQFQPLSPTSLLITPPHPSPLTTQPSASIPNIPFPPTSPPPPCRSPPPLQLSIATHMSVPPCCAPR